MSFLGVMYSPLVLMYLTDSLSDTIFLVLNRFVMRSSVLSPLYFIPFTLTFICWLKVFMMRLMVSMYEYRLDKISLISLYYLYIYLYRALYLYTLYVIHPKLVSSLFLVFPPVRAMWPNYEVLMLQPWSGTDPSLVYVDIVMY